MFYSYEFSIYTKYYNSTCGLYDLCGCTIGVYIWKNNTWTYVGGGATVPWSCRWYDILWLEGSPLDFQIRLEGWPGGYSPHYSQSCGYCTWQRWYKIDCTRMEFSNVSGGTTESSAAYFPVYFYLQNF